MIATFLLALSLAAAPAAPVRPRGTATDGLFQCALTNIHDGGGLIECGGRQRIQLQGIAARPANEISSLVLSALSLSFSAEPLACVQVGERGGRAVAWCGSAEGQDLACEMIREGVSARDPANDPEGRLRDCVARP